MWPCTQWQGFRLAIVIIQDVTFTKIAVSPLRQKLIENSVSLQPCPISTVIDTMRALKITAPRASSIEDEAYVQSTTSENITGTTFGLENVVIRAALDTKSGMAMEVAEAIDVGFSHTLTTKKHTTMPFKSDGASEAPAAFDFLDLFKTLDKCLEMDERSMLNAISAKEPYRTVQEAFDAIRDEFDIFARETGSDKFWSEVHSSQLSLTVAYIIEAFAKLGCNLSFLDTGELIPDVPHTPENSKLVKRLMRALQDYGLMIQQNGIWIRTAKPFTDQPPSSERYEQILLDHPQFASEHILLNVIGSHLDEYLTGDADPLLEFFGTPEKRDMMVNQFSIAPIQSALSRQLSHFIKQCFSSYTTGQIIRVLEIGGGSCQTTLYAVKAFADLGIPVEYTFSDISSSYITAAKSTLSSYNFIAYRTLDITQAPSADLKHHFDMILATNVMHATPNICLSTSTAREILKPGGFLTLVEYTTQMNLMDLICGQSDERWGPFDDGREHALMGVDDWKKVLTQAGFEKVGWTGGKTGESEILRILLAY